MNPKIYRQNDPRWGSLPYPVKSSPVSTDGCGLCAVTMCAIEREKYANYTPKDFYTFMKKYAVAGHGTEWSGIDAGLKQYLGNAKRFDDMTAFWNEVAKGNRVGVVLFHDGSAPDGTVWTTSGHYVCFVKYKTENGKHYLYTKDSGSRCHDGFYCYETSLKGCISLLWVAEVPKDGWIKEDGSWYYYKNGTMVKDEWVKDKSKWYYLGADGKMLSSEWLKWKGDWYYLTSDGSMATSQWIKDSNKWYFVGANGKMLRSRWLRWKNNFYYLKDDGRMQTGEATLPCAFDSEGRLLAE